MRHQQSNKDVRLSAQQRRTLFHSFFLDGSSFEFLLDGAGF